MKKITDSIRKTQSELIDRINIRVSEVLKGVECDASNRLKELDANLNKHSIESQQLIEQIKRIDEQIEVIPKTNKDISKCLDNLEAVLEDCMQELRRSGLYVPQEIPSSFVTLIEPDLGFELIEKQGGWKSSEFGENLSQMGEVKYKDTFSTCDNHTMTNNLEVPIENTIAKHDLLNCISLILIL